MFTRPSLLYCAESGAGTLLLNETNIHLVLSSPCTSLHLASTLHYIFPSSCLHHCAHPATRHRIQLPFLHLVCISNVTFFTHLLPPLTVTHLPHITATHLLHYTSPVHILHSIPPLYLHLSVRLSSLLSLTCAQRLGLTHMIVFQSVNLWLEAE